MVKKKKAEKRYIVANSQIAALKDNVLHTGQLQDLKLMVEITNRNMVDGIFWMCYED